MSDRIGMRIGADLSHDVVDREYYRNASGNCIFVCELGPPEYAKTDAQAREMSNRWEQAQLIKCWIREIWNELGGDG